MERQSGCDLLDEAAKLAAKKNLPTEDVTCPYIEVCDGSHCEIIEPSQIPVNTQSDKFFSRLEKTAVIFQIGK